MTDGESLEARWFSVSLGVLLWSLCTLYSFFLAALFNPQGFSLGLRRMVTASLIMSDGNLETWEVLAEMN